ncbi:MAG: hypothetical protein R3310_11280 [Candidatus Competibacteraceae bacterium]|nr:hypothetical protein [Candidatus Competibacteraceae bacterium]
MHKFTQVFRSIFATATRPAPEPRRNRQLSRDELISLMAHRKLSAAQAKAVMAKRFQD